MPLCNSQGDVDIFKINGFLFSKWIHKRVAKKPGPQNPQNPGLPRIRGSFHSDKVGNSRKKLPPFTRTLLRNYLSNISHITRKMNFFLFLVPGQKG